MSRYDALFPHRAGKLPPIQIDSVLTKEEPALGYDLLDALRLAGSPPCGAGWLSRAPADLDTLEGYQIKRDIWPTRFEEYAKIVDVLRTLPPGIMLDAASGYDPEIHRLPYMAEALGWYTVTVDTDPRTLQVPAGTKMIRWVNDIKALWRWYGADFDVWTCVSTLEHIDMLEHQMIVLDNALRVLRPGGLALLTVDMMAPARLNGLLAAAGFETGPVASVPDGDHLTPRVAWAVARKPT